MKPRLEEVWYAAVTELHQRIDVKQLFGTKKRKDLTIRLINSLLDGNQKRVVDVKFLKAVLDRETVVLRPSIVDVLCQADDGRKFIVEVQQASDTYFTQSLVEYTCRVYLNQHSKVIKNDSDRIGYGKMHPIICLAIMETPVFKTKKAYLSNREFRDVVTHELDIKELLLPSLSCRSLTKSLRTLRRMLTVGLTFFCHAGETPSDQWEKTIKWNNVFSRAYQALAEAAYSLEQLLTLRINQKEAEIMIQNEEAYEEGKAEEKLQLASKLLMRGMTLEDIAELKGLSESDIHVLTRS